MSWRPPKQNILLPLLLVSHQNLMIWQTALLRTPQLWSQEMEKSSWYCLGSFLLLCGLPCKFSQRIKVQRVSVNGVLSHRWGICITEAQGGGDKKILNVRGQGGPKGKLSSRHNRTITLTNVQKLRLPSQDLRYIKPVNTLPWRSQGTLAPTPNWRAIDGLWWRVSSIFKGVSPDMLTTLQCMAW